MLDYDKKDVGKKIKRFRKLRGLTQAELAEKIGISEKHVSKIEMGIYVPTLVNFINILAVLNISLEDIGIIINNDKSKLYTDFITLISDLSDKELQCCYDIVKTIKSLSN